jgi:hypothetical protein
MGTGVLIWGIEVGSRKGALIRALGSVYGRIFGVEHWGRFMGAYFDWGNGIGLWTNIVVGALRSVQGMVF